MSFVLISLIGFFIFLLFSITSIFLIRKCHQQRRAAIQRTSPPVVVTSTSHTGPTGYATQVPGYQTNVYMTAAQPPYPPQTGGVQQMPMPMPMQPPPGVQPYMAPYPPLPSANNMNPPSYDVVVAGNSSGQPNGAVYEKQAPYNPSYTSH